MNWRTDKPPHDEGTIIAMIGYPWPTMLMWNEYEITHWMPMPDIPMSIQIAANGKRIRAREALK